ncbi:MAG TPA: IclR family transcriptional regulator C-terminal domain-containing protein [Ilumatobacteraceae bacterium]|nr:IclR family transcriptional regulator C-terminal domain-containing protein [Ilumatobacteraceae bacterium]
MSSSKLLADGPERDYVQSLSRGLTVLQAFNAERPAMTLADMSRATGLTRATARRLLLTLVSLGYVGTDGRTFELTPRVLDLGFAYVSSLQLPDIAQPFMEALSNRVHESVSASVLDGSEIVYVARVNTQRIMRISLAIGSRLPAAWTSMGRVLLAGLSDGQLDEFLDNLVISELTSQSITDVEALRSELLMVRSEGYALVDQELEEGIRSVAAPLRDRRGRALAAINVGTHAARVTLKELRGVILPDLLATARSIESQLAKR